MCEVCGGRGDMSRGQCRAVSYCGQLHQKLDWRAGHKEQCKEEGTVKTRTSDWCLPQGLLAMEEEPAQDVTDNNDEKYKHLVEEASKGGGADAVEASNEEWEEIGKDQKEDKVMERGAGALSLATGTVARASATRTLSADRALAW